ncbi:MAG: arginine--tRNA ligase [Anaerolineae bacterium]|nr:arginine--tRNA ligase [Candidatus Roseilinea sp.]MDW8450983.1 arginine--tRNA ligase [Anaerolineae bacterium]
MIRDYLSKCVAEAIAKAQQAGELPDFPIPTITLEHPRQPEMGDYATSIAMQLARIAKMPPPKIAEIIAKRLREVSLVSLVSVVSDTTDTPDTSDTTDTIDTTPSAFTVEVVSGFINFRLTPAYLSRQVDVILEQGERWGNINLGKGRKAQVEHGSANPTGYATIGTGRNVVVGDTLANTLEAAGYQVHREWYINDAGSQVRVFGASVYARYAQALGMDEPLPERGYQGEDVQEVARIIAEREGDKYLHMPKDEAVRALGRLGIEEVMTNIKRTLARLNIRYDNFFSEKSLWTSGLGYEMIERLRAKGLVIEHDGALWFSEDGSPIRSGQGQRRTDEEYAADKDESGQALPVQAVLIRSPKVISDPEERPTYFASDIPYMWHKVMLRGFNPAIYVWGEDHQADVPRLYAAARAIGLPDGAIRILIYRFITLLRSGQEVRMGKRKGNALLIDDVVDEIGADAFRYIMLSRSVDTKFTFDLDVLKEQNEKNPVYYVQYGHARICSIERKAAEEGWDQGSGVGGQGSEAISSPLTPHPSTLTSVELALIRKLLQLPEVVELVATTLQPHHYTTYAREVTQAFSKFYEECRIKGSPPDVAHARMKLARATRLTLAKTLKLMGMNAPERM